MEILEAYDLSGCAHSAAELVGCDPKTVRRCVERRDRGLPVTRPGRRERLVDPFADKVEEWVDRSRGRSGRMWCTSGWSGWVVRGWAEHSAGGCGGEGPLAGWAPADLPGGGSPSRGCGASSTGAKARGCPGRAGRPGDTVVLFVVGLVTVPGGDPGLGPHSAHAAGLLGHRAAPAGRGTNVCADRQREDRHRRAQRPSPRAPVRGCGCWAVLRDAGSDVRALRPGVQGGTEASVRIARADLVPTEANLLETYQTCGRCGCRVMGSVER
jgi:hypothetical protein